MIELYRWRKLLAIVSVNDMYKLCLQTYIVHAMWADDSDEFTFQWCEKA